MAIKVSHLFFLNTMFFVYAFVGCLHIHDFADCSFFFFFLDCADTAVLSATYSSVILALSHLPQLRGNALKYYTLVKHVYVTRLFSMHNLCG